MSTTTVPAPRPAEEVEVLGLGAAATMAYLVERRRRQDAAAADELRAVAHWAELHRLGPGELIGAMDPDLANDLCRRGFGGEDVSVAGVEGELRLAGEGAFMV